MTQIKPIFALLYKNGYNDYDMNDTIFDSLWYTLIYELSFEQYYNEQFIIWNNIHKYNVQLEKNYNLSY